MKRESLDPLDIEIERRAARRASRHYWRTVRECESQFKEAQTVAANPASDASLSSSNVLDRNPTLAEIDAFLKAEADVKQSSLQIPSQMVLLNPGSLSQSMGYSLTQVPLPTQPQETESAVPKLTAEAQRASSSSLYMNVLCCTTEPLLFASTTLEQCAFFSSSSTSAVPTSSNSGPSSGIMLKETHLLPQPIVVMLETNPPSLSFVLLIALIDNLHAFYSARGHALRLWGLCAARGQLCRNFAGMDPNYMSAALIDHECRTLVADHAHRTLEPSIRALQNTSQGFRTVDDLRRDSPVLFKGVPVPVVRLIWKAWMRPLDVFDMAWIIKTR